MQSAVSKLLTISNKHKQSKDCLFEFLVNNYGDIFDEKNCIRDENSTIIILYFKLRSAHNRRLLLVSHYDTVFSESNYRDPFVSDEKIHGSGVLDMRSGIIIMLESLKQSYLNISYGVDLVISFDEETGSLISMPYILEIAKKNDLALVFEPALDSKGTFSRQRKGKGNVEVQFSGKKAHSGRNITDGVNAIVAAAKFINEFTNVFIDDESITINIANLYGGGAANVVPDEANLLLEFRVNTKEEYYKVEKCLAQVVKNVSANTGAKISYEINFYRPPKKFTTKTNKLYNLLKDCCSELKLNYNLADTGGCCDGNNLEDAGLAVIDTMGAIGKGIHTSEEYVLISSIEDRIKLCSRLFEKIDSEWSFK